MFKTTSQTEITLLESVLKEQKKLFNQEALNHYIAPQLIRYPDDKHPEDAYTQINLWLQDKNQNTLLLLGDSGAGKTLFNQWLTLEIFTRRAKGEAVPIPLFIPLLVNYNAKMTSEIC